MSDKVEPYILPERVLKSFRDESLPSQTTKGLSFGRFHDTLDSVLRIPHDPMLLWRNQLPELGPTQSTMCVVPFHNPGLDADKVMNNFEPMGTPLGEGQGFRSLEPQRRQRNAELWPVGLAPGALARPNDRGVARFVQRTEQAEVTTERAVQQQPTTRKPEAKAVKPPPELKKELKSLEKEQQQQRVAPPATSTPPPTKLGSKLSKAAGVSNVVANLLKETTGESIFSRFAEQISGFAGALNKAQENPGQSLTNILSGGGFV